MSYTYTCTIVPGQSCSEILLAAPECRGQSGQFWIENATAQAVEVYCDMVALGGGWERVALFDASNSLQCPGTLNPHVFNGTTLCSNGGATAEVRFIPTAPFSEMRGTGHQDRQTCIHGRSRKLKAWAYTLNENAHNTICPGRLVWMSETSTQIKLIDV